MLHNKYLHEKCHFRHILGSYYRVFGHTGKIQEMCEVNFETSNFQISKRGTVTEFHKVVSGSNLKLKSYNSLQCADINFMIWKVNFSKIARKYSALLQKFEMIEIFVESGLNLNTNYP